MYRVLFVVHRKSGLSREDFLRHYRENHVPIARAFPGLLDYRIFPRPADAEGAPDAFAVMTFASEEAFGAATQGPEFARAVEDNESFVERFETYPVDYIGVVEADASRA
jgi:uncharacterized protein (TIGR02118 family)